MSRATLVAEIQAAAASAQTLSARVVSGALVDARIFENEANDVRAVVRDLISRVDAEWGVDGNATIRALRGLAASLLDLRSAVSNASATVTITTTRMTSLIELAAQRYSDMDRWTDLAALNPQIPHPGFVPAQSEVLVYVS